MSYNRKTVFPPEWTISAPQNREERRFNDVSRPPASSSTRRHLPPVPEDGSDDTQSLPAKPNCPHHSSIAQPVLHCHIQLGERGYEYIVAENSENQAFLAYPLSGLPLEVQQENIRKVQSHQSFVKIYSTFSHRIDGLTYDFAAQELMWLSLSHLRGIIMLTDVGLASIVTPILKALTFLHGMDLEHGSLSCSTCQLDYNGNLKICGYENCRAFTTDRDMLSFRRLLHELIDGFELDGDYKSFKLPRKGEQLSEEGLNFVQHVMETKATASAILEHKFLRKTKSSPEALQGLLAMANVCVGIAGGREPSWERLRDERKIITQLRSYE
ncbi:Protein kinase-like domain protein [Akanthomyces lecanii RCEF 1005]|uniref:Protein kinase-like domain protein n=1 Tax=Akanthomyces lecanii RCEF 1005 TaxID=1081108 RepID=A0A167XLE5_CORDF|nr:Protein kinase-like domain protein [Akanthomyces lecanii RCEF 1005]